MFPKKDVWCHRTGFEKTCLEMVTQKGCQLWGRLEIKHHPQTGDPYDEYACADSWTPLLLMHLGHMQSQTTASVDKVANEVKTHRDESVALGAIGVQRLRDAAHEAVERALLPAGNGAQRRLGVERSDAD